MLVAIVENKRRSYAPLNRLIGDPDSAVTFRYDEWDMTTKSEITRTAMRRYLGFISRECAEKGEAERCVGHQPRRLQRL